MFERRMSALVAAVVVLLASAVLWDLFVRPPRPRAPPGSQAESVVVSRSGPLDTAVRAASAPPSAPPAPSAAPGDGGSNGPSYIVLLARSETRRRIRASKGLAYLSDIVVESQDSMLHRVLALDHDVAQVGEA